MKTIAFLFACLLVTIPLEAQIHISAEDWQKDLKFLQHTVHADYPFLFKKITAEQFDSEVETLDKAIPELQEHEIVIGLARIVSAFQYGHTTLRIQGSPFKYHQLPINLYQFSDGIYVEGVKKENAEILGAKLVAIEGKPIDDVLAAIRPVVPAENDQFFKAYSVLYMTSPEILHAQGVMEQLQNTLTLTLERDGKSFDKEITAVSARHFPVTYGFSKQGRTWLSSRDQSETPHYLRNLDRLYYFEYLSDNKTVYIRHSQIQDDARESIPEFYKRVFQFVEENDVERLVLDVRLNGGGNNYKNKPIVTGIIEAEKINQPGKLFVIIGRRTFSACQNLVNELDNYTNAIFVGEPTSENINFYGDNRQVQLPNSKLTVSLSYAWWQDKPQWENDDWLAPQLAVDMSFDDYRNNRDPVLQAALEFNDDDFILDPMAHLTALFQAGELDQLKEEAKRLVNNPKYRFFNFESQANQAGYNLLGDGKTDEAMFVFQLNTELYPKSANAWDSLAEVHWKTGKLEKAIELYKEAIELDPGGPIGDNARAMLKTIQADQDR